MSRQAPKKIWILFDEFNLGALLSKNGTCLSWLYKEVETHEDGFVDIQYIRGSEFDKLQAENEELKECIESSTFADTGKYPLRLKRAYESGKMTLDRVFVLLKHYYDKLQDRNTKFNRINEDLEREVTKQHEDEK